LRRLQAAKKFPLRALSFVKVGVDTLPEIPRDNTDRNRTSPFAFTGNKFEFRMVGSAQSIAGCNVALNTIAAEALDEIATRLEKAKDKNAEAAAIIRDAYKKHSRVIFNGNNYSEAWPKEAAKRGLPNVTNAVDALKAFVTNKSLKLFEKYEVLSHKEVHSRYDIYVEIYAKQINIEALAAIDMVKKAVHPGSSRVRNLFGRLSRQFQGRLRCSPCPGGYSEEARGAHGIGLQKPRKARSPQRPRRKGSPTP